MTELPGQPLFEVWQELMKNMKWNDFGILVVSTGLTSINIAKMVKLFAVYMQKATALVL